MLEPEFDPVPTGCSDRAMRLSSAVPSITVLGEPNDDSSSEDCLRRGPVRQIELCARHAQEVIARERARA